jgi:uncharacterized protein YrrD
MLDITNDTGVYTAHDRHVGTVGRIILDPTTRAVSHVVVRQGVFFPEDRLVPIADIATATPQRINLRRDVGLDDLLPFVEQYYVPLEEADRPSDADERSVRFAMPLSGPVGEVMPAAGADFVPVRERNIPDRLLALEAGVPVFASDRHEVGRLDRIVTDDQGQPSHIVVEDGGLLRHRRALSIDQVRDITENVIALDATRDEVDAIAPLTEDE